LSEGEIGRGALSEVQGNVKDLRSFYRGLTDVGERWPTTWAKTIDIKAVNGFDWLVKAKEDIGR
jgi:hypothetical protein